MVSHGKTLRGHYFFRSDVYREIIGSHCGAASGLILALIGYQSNVVQTAETLNGLFLCVSLLPAVGAVIRIVIMSKYTFTEEKHAEICEKLKRGEFHHSVLISKK
uniref:hypothetical protein n=1 Tax=Escherichia coli TaxID=562 RepID=UPI0021F8A6C7|nr:hypothetical protein [Escherichia coli]